MDTKKIVTIMDNAVLKAESDARLNNYTYLKSDSNSVKVYLLATDEVVIFEKTDVLERQEHSEDWEMVGIVFHNLYGWTSKYEAIASFEIASDEFEVLTEIKSID